MRQAESDCESFSLIVSPICRVRRPTTNARFNYHCGMCGQASRGCSIAHFGYGLSLSAVDRRLSVRESTSRSFQAALRKVFVEVGYVLASPGMLNSSVFLFRRAIFVSRIIG